MEVALSLGLYTAERCKGPFKDTFITFSERPKIQQVVGEDVYEKLSNMSHADWGMNTNIKAVFNLLLNIWYGIRLLYYAQWYKYSYGRNIWRMES